MTRARSVPNAAIWKSGPGLLLTIAAAAALALGPATAHAQGAEPAAPPPPPEAAQAPASSSGLPIPRFVSLKSDRVNLRTGPGTQYPTSWVFRRAGLPLEVTKEFENWRQVRDSEGTSGWVLQSLLSGRRTALVSPWDAKEGKASEGIPIRASDSESSSPLATVEPGVIANLHTCDGRWCDVSVGDYRGYLPQKLLWGVYENETVK